MYYTGKLLINNETVDSIMTAISVFSRISVLIGAVKVCEGNTSDSQLLSEGSRILEGCSRAVRWRITCNYTGIGYTEKFNHTLYRDQVQFP